MISSLDAGRRWVWRQAVRTRTGRTCARDRSARVLALALGHVGVAFVLAALGPMWLLIAGPVVLGVPHLVADLRYLIVRNHRLTAAATIGIAAPLAAIAALHAMQLAGGRADALAEVGFGCAAIAIAIGLAAGRRAPVAVLAVGLAVPALAWPELALLALAHVHNVVAIGIWLWWSQHTVSRAHRLATISTIALATLVLAAAAGSPPADAAPIVSGLAPGLSDDAGWRLVVVYVFLQSVHYAIWLRLIPSAHGRPSTFRRSVAMLREDFGARGVVVVAVVSLAVPLAACVGDPRTARDVYLSFATFHGWLELAVIAYLAAGRRRA
ncbi:MAG TPA: hypothetical protein VFQ53_03735 [Kofleriaceae bacterium]|nr:hypothetical protein [Kofleriaceae bacterium]